jgi:predicted transglutaminase-like cysteine proteinase
MHVAILCIASFAGGAALGLRFKVLSLVPATALVALIAAGVEFRFGAPWQRTVLLVALTAAALQIGYVLAVLRSYRWASRPLLIVAVTLASFFPLDAIAFSQMRTGEGEFEPLGFTLFCAAKPQRCEKSQPKVVIMTPQRWRELYDVNWSVNHSVKATGPLGPVETWRDEGREGSCVLYANTKRSMLLDRGWPPSALLLTVVRVDGNPGDHLVLESLGDGMGSNYFGPYEVYHDHRWLKQMSPEDPRFWRHIISWLRSNPEPLSCKY